MEVEPGSQIDLLPPRSMGVEGNASDAPTVGHVQGSLNSEDPSLSGKSSEGLMGIERCCFLIL